MPKRLDARSADFEALFADVLSLSRENDANVNHVVAEILADVAKNGDQALVKYTNQFDRQNISPSDLAFNAADIQAATHQVNDDLMDALKTAATRIESFHKRQIPGNEDYIDQDGVRLGYRWTPVGAAGLYVPGGLAAYPSSVLMNAIPARVAGVKRLVMVVPTPDGTINPLVLAAAHIAGVHEVYRVGGAQAIGALAYGTATITAVDKIVGPGNAYVAAAKRQVFGTVGIDMIAGPSEILVVADGDNDPAWIAADMLSQAEHDTNAQSILITDDDNFAARVEDAIEHQLLTLNRESIARPSWENFGVVILVDDILADAPDIIDRIAPEHLELAVDDPDVLAQRVTNAGAIFLGRHTPEAIGDYVAGPNHVLPTSRTARFSSGLGVSDFMKRTTFIGCHTESLKRIGPAARKLAKAEGLDAHERSISIRLNQ